MKIIRKRAGPDWWVRRQATCESCLSIIELEKGDKVKEYNTPGLLSVYFNCPECKHELRVYYN